MLTPQLTSDLLTKAVETDPWYGSSTMALVEPLTSGEASARPISDGHSIWEIVLHMIAWQDEVARRLEGGEPALPVSGDWPAVVEVDDEHWRATLCAFVDSSRRLGERISRLPVDQWDTCVEGDRSAELGTGVSNAEMIVGVLQHNAYHTGQIGLLSKLVLSGRR